MAAPMNPPPHAPDFLAACGWGGARDPAACRRRIVPPLFPGDRRRARSAVLMDAPPPHEDPRPFIAVAEWLVGHGLSAPEILARDLDKGLLLLGDFGDVAPARDPRRRPAARARALRARDRRPGSPARPSADGRAASRTGSTSGWRSWSCSPTGIARRSDSEVDADGLSRRRGARCWSRSRVTASARSPCFATIMPRTSCWSTGASGVAHFGLLDFQDALAGHPAYDLASVLEDARRDVPPEIERAMIDRYVARDRHGDAFERAYWALAAQRNTRILGVFTRLWKRDDKPRLPALPAAHVGPSRARPRTAAAGAGPRRGSTPISRPSIAARRGSEAA